jgi:hypothetical protein
MTMNLLAHRHLFGFFLRCRWWWQARRLIIISLLFFSSVANDNELEGSSLFLGFFLRCKSQWRASRLIIISWFYSSNAKDDNELGGSQLVVIPWFFSQVQKTTINLLFVVFFSYYTQRHHVSCPIFNVMINKISIIKINL